MRPDSLANCTQTDSAVEKKNRQSSYHCLGFCVAFCFVFHSEMPWNISTLNKSRMYIGSRKFRSRGASLSCSQRTFVSEIFDDYDRLRQVDVLRVMSSE